MLPEFRYEGVDAEGRIVQGALHAKNAREARRKAEGFAKSRRFRIAAIQKKVAWAYKVQKGDDAAITGVQKAFTREEVEGAFRKLGYHVVSLRKRSIDLELRPPMQQVTLFIRMCADLLRQGMSYDEVLRLQLSDAQHPVLRQTIKRIAQDLRDGKDGKQVYEKHGDVFGRFAAQMLGLASKSGRMAEIYDQTARFLDRNEDFKKSMRSALLMPAVTIVGLIIASLFYVAWVFPKTAKLFLKYDLDVPPMTAATLAMSNFIQGNLVWMLLLIIAGIIGIVRWLSTPRGRLFRDRWILKLPIMGPLMHKTSTEIFCRVFHTLYQGSGENIEAIRTAAEACQNTWMEKRITEVAIPLMTQEGLGIIEAFRRTGVFHKNVLYRLNSGAEAGTLRDALVQIADYYETETKYRLKGVVDGVQVMIGVAVTFVMVALTLISSESAVVSPKMPGL